MQRRSGRILLDHGVIFPSLGFLDHDDDELDHDDDDGLDHDDDDLDHDDDDGLDHDDDDDRAGG